MCSSRFFLVDRAPVADIPFLPINPGLAISKVQAQRTPELGSGLQPPGCSMGGSGGEALRRQGISPAAACSSARAPRGLDRPSLPHLLNGKPETLTRRGVRAGWCCRRGCRGPELVEGGSTSFTPVPRSCDWPREAGPPRPPPPAPRAHPRPAGHLRLQACGARPLRPARRLGPACWGRAWRARSTHTRCGLAGGLHRVRGVRGSEGRVWPDPEANWGTRSSRKPRKCGRHLGRGAGALPGPARPESAEDGSGRWLNTGEARFCRSADIEGSWLLGKPPPLGLGGLGTFSGGTSSSSVEGGAGGGAGAGARGRRRWKLRRGAAEGPGLLCSCLSCSLATPLGAHLLPPLALCALCFPVRLVSYLLHLY